MYKKILLVLFVILSFQANATHLLGGEISWECRPNGKFRFTLVLYRDCGSSVTLPTTAQTLSTNCGTAISCSYVSTTDVVPSCYTGTVSCSSSSISGLGRMQKYVYQSSDIQLYGSPPVSGWYFTWSSCCRPSSVSNVTNAGSANYMLRAIMYPYIQPGNSVSDSMTVNGVASCYDSSPNFLEDPKVVACTNTDMSLNLLGYDTNVDSLVYSWSYPWDATSFSSNSSTNSVNFATGYSHDSPLPSTGTSTGAFLDSATGEISFNSALSGSWATCVQIEEWRNGQLIGAVYRDLPIFTLACTPPTGLCSSGYVSSAPYIHITLDSSLLNQLVLVPVVNSAGDTNQYNLNVGVDDSIILKIIAADPWPNPSCHSQNITLEPRGGNLSSASNYSNSNTCLFNPPCATITSLNTSSSFTSTAINESVFNWKIDTAHFSYGGLEPSKSYEFYFTASDDECPVNKSRTVKLVVNIQTDVPSPPNITNYCAPSTGSGILLEWTPSVDTGSSWGYYLIHHLDTSGSSSILDTVFPWNTSSYYDVVSDTNNINRYRIQAVSSLGFASPYSEIIGEEIEVVYTPFGSNTKSLNWVPSNPTLGNNSFLLQKRINANWILLDTVSGLNSYMDSTSVCNGNIQYELSSNNNCIALSKRIQEMDIVAPDFVSIKNASINAQNNLEIDFDKSLDQDVSFYRVYEKDSTGMYQPKDSISNNNFQMPVQVNINATANAKSILVTAHDTCGNISPAIDAESFETLHLTVVPTDSSFSLFWNNQTNDSGTVYYSVYWQEYNGTTPGNYSLVANQLDTSIVIARDIGFETFCGYVQSKSSASPYYSESNRVCVSFVDIPENNIEFSIRPNPSNGVFTIELFEFDEIYQAEVFDMLGQSIYKRELSSGENIIRLSKSVASGSYLLKVANKQSGLSEKRVLIVQ